MTVPLGTMALPGGEDSDNSRGYLNGTLPDGGLWTALTRLSNHDHTGGSNGVVVTPVIPPGSITSGQLDPSVLAPYALVDGSKPFSGQVTMQHDAVVRDTLFFGQEGSASPPDAWWQWMAASTLRTDASVGVRATPGASALGLVVAKAGASAPAVFGQILDGRYALGCNVAYDGSWQRLDPAKSAFWLEGTAGSPLGLFAVPAGANPIAAPSPKLQVSSVGTVVTSPDPGQPAVIVPDGAPVQTANPAAGELVLSGGAVRLRAGTGTTREVVLYGPSGGFYPAADNTLSCGVASGGRWTLVAAVNGVIQSSSADFKTGITPLDPFAAMAAVRNTPAVTFSYLAPARDPGFYEYDADPEVAEQQLYQQLVNGPLEAAARHQAGFVAEDAAELFLTGPGQTNPANTAGVLLAAIQNLDARLTAGGM